MSLHFHLRTTGALELVFALSCLRVFSKLYERNSIRPSLSLSLCVLDSQLQMRQRACVTALAICGEAVTARVMMMDTEARGMHKKCGISYVGKTLFVGMCNSENVYPGHRHCSIHLCPRLARLFGCQPATLWVIYIANANRSY